MSQLSHAQFPLRRHPDLLVDHRRARSAAVAEPRGANDQSRDRLRWPASFRNGGRDQIRTVADIKSESGGLCEVADARVGRHGGRPHIRSHGEVDSDQRSGRVRLRTPTLETTMPAVADRPDAPTAIQTNLAAIFVSLELSRSIWLITSLSPGSGEKMSKHSVRAGDVAALLARFSELKRKASERTGKSFPIVVIQEAGLDGFWLHRVLQSEGVESHVVDPSSIATSRRRRRAKTDRIDGEALLRALLAFKRGEPRVCAMVKAPTPEEEDRRRLGRERKVLIAERVKHVNRVKG